MKTNDGRSGKTKENEDNLDRLSHGSHCSKISVRTKKQQHHAECLDKGNQNAILCCFLEPTRKGDCLKWKLSPAATNRSIK